jgi:hypothetical protein
MTLETGQRRELIRLGATVRNGAGPYGAWRGGDEIAPGVLRSPYFEYASAVRQLEAAIGPLIVPFAWPEWREGIDLLREPLPADLHHISPVTAVKLMTVIVRSDRFAEGTILDKLEDGTVGRLLAVVCSAL